MKKMHNGKHPSACNVDELSEQFVARMPNVSLQIECKKQHTVEDQSKLHDLLNGNVDNNGVYNSNELNRQKLLDAELKPSMVRRRFSVARSCLQPSIQDIGWLGHRYVIT